MTVLRKILIGLLLSACAYGQNQNVAAFPTTVAVDQDLLVAVRLSSSTLTSSPNSSTLSMTVADGTRFRNYEEIRIDNEELLICSISSNTLTICSGGRGFNGTTAAAHTTGAAVQGTITSWHHNQLAAEMKAVQARLRTTAIACNPSGASGTTYTCSPTPPLATYTPGLTVAFKPDVSSSGTATINISGLGAQSLFHLTASGGVAVGSGDLVGGVEYLMIYNGAAFDVLGIPLSATSLGSLTGCIGATSGTPSARTITAGGGITLANGDCSGNPTVTAAAVANAQTSTSYTIATGDRGKLVTFSNGSAIAVTLPQAGGTFPDGWYVWAKNIGAGDATITPTTSTISGAATAVLSTGEECLIVSNGTHYEALCNRLIQGANVTLTKARTGTTIAASGGGGGTMPFTVVRTSDTRLTLGPECATGETCNVRDAASGTIIEVRVSATCDISGLTGDAWIYIDPTDGRWKCGHNGLTLTCNANCDVVASTTAPPETSAPVYKWSAAVAATWDADGDDLRAPLTIPDVGTALKPDIQAGTYNRCVASNGSGTYTCTGTPTLTAYTDGMVIHFKQTGYGGAGTPGSQSLNIDGLGAKLITWSYLTIASSDPTAACYPAQNMEVKLTYNSANNAFIMTECPGFNTLGRIPVLSSKIWLPAVGCSGTTGSLMWDTLATAAPTATCSAGSTETNLMRGVADFLDAGTAQMQQPIMLPADFTGAIDVILKWRTAATSGNVFWQVSTICRADGEVDDATFNTASTVADAAKGTTLQLNDAAITGITTIGCAAGELMHLRVLRDPTDGSDTLGATASLVGVEVTTRRAQ